VTKATALRKARALWGKTAAVKEGRCYHWRKARGKEAEAPHCSGFGCGGHVHPCPGDVVKKTIGRIELGMFFMVKGEGSTWEQAFEQYQENERRDHERFLVAAAGAELVSK